MKLSDALVTTLRDLGVEHVFGVSGANIEHLHDAIHRLGTDHLTSVLTKTESGAAFMADAYARMHGTLGVCCSTSGGGMMNLAVGIAESYAESVPVLAIVGQVPQRLEGRGGFQDSSGIGRSVDARGLFSAIAKHVAVIKDPTTLWAHLQAALGAALSGRPGPAVLLVPRDVFELEVPERPQHFPLALSALRRPQGAADLSPVLAALRDARMPVLVWGPGVSRAGASAELARFVRELGLSVVTTMGDPGAFPHDDPLFLGIVGAAGHPSAHALITEQADLIVTVGSELGVMVRTPIAAALERAHLLSIDVDMEPVLRAVPRARCFEVELGEGIGRLLDALHAAPFRVAAPRGYRLTRYEPAFADASACAEHDCENGFGTSEALDVLQAFLPRRGQLLFDAGNCAASAVHRLSVPHGLKTAMALGMGGMGYAIAGAIGAQLRARDAGRTLALVGDGAFLMHGLEVHTAVELGLPILFVVFNDAQHGMCVTRQRLLFEGRIEATRYQSLDVAKTASGLGPEASLWVKRAHNASELRAALHEYDRLSPARPGVLELLLTREELPPFAPFVAHDRRTAPVRLPSDDHELRER